MQLAVAAMLLYHPNRLAPAHRLLSVGSLLGI